MSLQQRLHNSVPEITEWRRDIHQHPELEFDVHRTAGLVVEKLREFGVDEVVEGIGRTGVVGIIEGRKTGAGKTIGLRADMDALPIIEITGKPYASKTEGKMHACGHDGHTAMLLGAAKALAESREFAGRVAVIFQPAEEGLGGGREMVNDGMMDRFRIDEVYGMHNLPGLPVGEFAVCEGPIMASADAFDIIVEGKGGHAAMPHLCIDANVIASHVVIALQSIASRVINPLSSLVVSVTTIATDGDTYNVIPQRVNLKGTVRSLDETVRDLAETQVIAVAENTARAHGGVATVDYRRDYPVTRNAVNETQHAIAAASVVAGVQRVDSNTEPMMAAEDFSYMLNARPGAFIFVGNGDSASLHHPAYDFNDQAIPVGCSYWLELVSQRLA